MHSHAHHHSHEHRSTKALATAFWLNLVFSVIELIGGLFTNSMAIISDAIHDFGDSVAIGSALFLERFSEKRRDRKFSYGYRRFSSLSAFITSGILLAGSIWITVEAIPRLLNPEEVNGLGMIALAFVGIAFNGLAVLRLKGNKKSLNERSVRLHLMEDVLGWVAVLIGALLIHFFGWMLVDPILSIAIAIYIFVNAISNIKEVSKVFLQGVPSDLNINDIESSLMNNVDQVREIHDMHVWSMDGNYNILTLHVVVPDGLQMKNLRSIKNEIKKILAKEFDLTHVTMEFETQAEDCELENC